MRNRMKNATTGTERSLSRRGSVTTSTAGQTHGAAEWRTYLCKELFVLRIEWARSGKATSKGRTTCTVELREQVLR